MAEWSNCSISYQAIFKPSNDYENSIRVRLSNTGDLISFPLQLFISYNSADPMSF